MAQHGCDRHQKQHRVDPCQYVILRDTSHRLTFGFRLCSLFRFEVGVSISMRLKVRGACREAVELLALIFHASKYHCQPRQQKQHRKDGPWGLGLGLGSPGSRSNIARTVPGDSEWYGYGYDCGYGYGNS